MKYKIFARGSTTYYNAAKFFPKAFREEITILYAFVRKVDDFVDVKPVDKKSFIEWEQEWQEVWNGKKTTNKIIREFVELAKEKDFDRKWIESFFASMRFDLEGKVCESKQDAIWYMYGSAEVIGLMIARLMEVKPKAYESAALLGRAMQYINFIRDIADDAKLERTYLPEVVMHRPKTSKEEERFNSQLRHELKQFYVWNTKARKGFHAIPYKYRIGIMTATDMFEWTAKVIEKNPLVVFERKVKPKPLRIALTGIKNVVKALWI